MQKLVLIPLILVTTWFLPLRIFADQQFHAFQVRSSKPNLLKILTNQKSKKITVQFQIRIAGIGRLKLRFNKLIKPNDVFYDNNRLTNQSITHFKGFTQNNNFKVPVAGSAFAFSHLPTSKNLFLNFSTKRKHRSNLNTLKLSLTNQKDFARLYRQSKSDPIACGTRLQEAHFSSSVSTEKRSLSSLSTYKEIELNIDADAYWYQIFGSDSHNFISMFLNQVETIHEEQLGLTFKIVRQNVFTDRNFGNGYPPNQLDSYIGFTNQYDYSNLVDISYILSGKKNFLDSIRGVANYATLCFEQNNSFGTNQFTDLLSTSSVVAHEIAHIIGAIHDDGINYDGNICPNEEEFIMSAFLNTSSPQSSFSPCSINSINNYLADADFCLATVSTDSIDATPNTLPPRTPMENPQPIDPFGSINLKVKLNKSGVVTITTTWEAEENLNDCRLYIDADYNQANLTTINSKSFNTLPLKASPFSIKVKVPFNIKAKNKKLSLQSRLVCNSAEISRSNIATIKPGKVVSLNEIKPKQWLARLDKKLKN